MRGVGGWLIKKGLINKEGGWGVYLKKKGGLFFENDSFLWQRIYYVRKKWEYVRGLRLKYNEGGWGDHLKKTELVLTCVREVEFFAEFQKVQIAENYVFPKNLDSFAEVVEIYGVVLENKEGQGRILFQRKTRAMVNFRGKAVVFL